MPDPCNPFSEHLLFTLNNSVGDADKALKVATAFGKMASNVMTQMQVNLNNPSALLNQFQSSILSITPPLPSVDDIINCPAAECLIPEAAALAGMPLPEAEIAAQLLLTNFSNAQRGNINAAVGKAISEMAKTPLGMLASMQSGLAMAMKSLGVGSDVTSKFSSILTCMELHNPSMVQDMRASGSLDNFDAVTEIGDPASVDPSLQTALESASTDMANMKSNHTSDVSDFLP